MVEIQLEGMEELNRRLDRTTSDILSEADQGLAKAGMKIIADSQLMLRQNGTNNTGLLSNSGKVQKVSGGYDVGFFSESNGYAEYVEYGRRSGRFPPLKMIREWAKKKLRIDDRRLDSAAFLIGRKISRKGTRPQPFFSPSVSKNQKEVLDVISEAINKVTK